MTHEELKNEFYLALRNRFSHTTRPYEDIAGWALNDFIAEHIANKLRQYGVMQAEVSEMCGSDCCPDDGACEHCQNPIKKSAEGAAVGKERGAQSQCDGIKHSPFSIKGLDGIIRCADCGTQLYPRGTP